MTMYERPPEGTGDPVVLGKCALALADLLQTSDSERVSCCVTGCLSRCGCPQRPDSAVVLLRAQVTATADCKLDVIELPSTVTATLREVAARKVIAASAPPEDPAAAKKPAAKGKAAAPEAPAPLRELTAEEAVEAEKAFKEARKAMIAAVQLTVTVSVGVVLAGPLTWPE